MVVDKIKGGYRLPYVGLGSLLSLRSTDAPLCFGT
jgi:hypothetical protein